MKKMKFEKPEMEKVMFEAEDVIVTSGGCMGDCQHICGNDCQMICEGICYSVTGQN